MIFPMETLLVSFVLEYLHKLKHFWPIQHLLVKYLKPGETQCFPTDG